PGPRARRRGGARWRADPPGQPCASRRRRERARAPAPARARGDPAGGGRRPVRVVALLVPSAAYLLAMFVFPFAYGVLLSLRPKGGAVSLATYVALSPHPWPARPIWVTPA